MAMVDPATCHTVGIIPRSTALRTVCTIAFVLIIALVGPARPLTMAFSPIKEVNMSREDDTKVMEKLYNVYVGSSVTK